MACASMSVRKNTQYDHKCNTPEQQYPVFKKIKERSVNYRTLEIKSGSTLLGWQPFLPNNVSGNCPKRAQVTPILPENSFLHLLPDQKKKEGGSDSWGHRTGTLLAWPPSKLWQGVERLEATYLELGYKLNKRARSKNAQYLLTVQAIVKELNYYQPSRVSPQDSPLWGNLTMSITGTWLQEPAGANQRP